MTNESTEARPGSTSAPQLTGNLGVGSIVFMVVAAAAPLTVIGGNVPLAIGLGNGAGAPVGFLIASAVLFIFSIGFVTMTPHVKEAGAFFSYVTEGLGRRAGTGTAVVALISYTAIQLGVYGYIGWAINDTVTYYNGPTVPWPVYAFATLALVAILGYRHIELSARVLTIALVLEISIAVALDISITAQGGHDGLNLTSFGPHAISSGPLGIAVLFALTGFIGFEATAVFRDEARDPARTIPRATYIAVLLIGAFYTISCWALVIAAGVGNADKVADKTLAGNGNMLFDTTQHYLGHAGRDIVNVLLLSSLFACVLSFHNVIARYQFVLARRGLLPRVLGTIDATHRAPSRSSLVQTVTAALCLLAFTIIGLDPLVGVFGSMAGVATVGMVTLMLTTSIAVLVFFAKHPELAATKPFASRVAPALAGVGLAISAWLVLSNFTLVTGGSIAVSTILALVVPIGFVVGVTQGVRLQPTELSEDSRL